MMELLARATKSLFRTSGQTDPAFHRAMREASGRMKSVERMCEKIEHLRDFNVFGFQCAYLVQIISKDIQEVKERYFLILEDEDSIWKLFYSKKLSQLISSFDSLLRDLMSAERLLQACGGKKWTRVSLVLSMPPPELEKYTGSTFFLLINDFKWSLRIVRHSLQLPDAPQSSIATEQSFSTEELRKMKSSDLSTNQSGDIIEYKWSPLTRRYLLTRNGLAFERDVESLEDDDQQAFERQDEIRVETEAMSHEAGADQQASSSKDVTGVAVDREEFLKGDFDRQAHDRKNLLDIVEKHMTTRARGSSFFSSVWQLSRNTLLEDETVTNKFLAVVKNRCQDTSRSGSANLVSKCFEIDHLDLKKKNSLSRGASKRIFRAHWLGQEAAVAIIEQIPRDVVEKEAGFLVTLHHPNVVDFFGFALKEEALTEEEMAAVEKIEPKWTGYLVMEKMQEDLRNLIDKLLRGPRNQEYGGPFSLSITVDILLQIVGAMIHTHKFDIMHRDLKARNCLVNPKPVSSYRAQGVSSQYYTVKLTDFGESKLWVMGDKQTEKKGTLCWMAPEVWGGSDYLKSADVYSFGITCYEIVTGKVPFEEGNQYRVMDEVVEGRRPRIPGTCPQSLSDLMKKCWAHAPHDRPTFEEIRGDLWAIKRSVDVPIEV